MYEKIKNFYNKGIYSKKIVADFVKKGKITIKQYEEIVGEEYAAGVAQS